MVRIIAARPGTDPVRLAMDACRPELVHCSISGYGEEGPYAKRKAYDMLIQAESGLASVTGGPEAPARVLLEATREQQRQRDDGHHGGDEVLAHGQKS